MPTVSAWIVDGYHSAAIRIVSSRLAVRLGQMALSWSILSRKLGGGESMQSITTALAFFNNTDQGWLATTISVTVL